MASILVIVSILIKAIALLIVCYSFFMLNPKKEREILGPLTKYFLLRKNFLLLRWSLVFVAALLLVELISISISVVGNADKLADIRLLTSDLVFLGLIMLLTQIYRHRDRLSVIDG